jgi:hypothetical protein
VSDPPTARPAPCHGDDRENPDDVALAAALADFEADGWVGRVDALAGGEVRCRSCGTEVDATVLPADGLQRLVSPSDPADAVLVVPVTCPSCAARGVLVARIGPDEGPEDADVLDALGRGVRNG